ncbi:MAG TPA: Dabb family protein [Opitutaceae bacterium]
MANQTRRQFVAGAVALGAASSVAAASKSTGVAGYPLVHHVFFWLKNPGSKDNLAKLLARLKTLSGIETVKAIHIGVPASTEKRDVVDNSFAVSEILCFENVEGQNAYQVHPIHKAFVEKCSALWEKHIVYDAISV